METIDVQWPPIKMKLDHKLLSYPFFKFDSNYLLKISEFLLNKMGDISFYKFQRTKNNIYLKHLYFMELYEQAKIKEEECKGKAINKASWPFYRPRLPNKDDQRLFERLDHRANTSQRMLRKNNKVSKV